MSLEVATWRVKLWSTYPPNLKLLVFYFEIHLLALVIDAKNWAWWHLIVCDRYLSLTVGQVIAYNSLLGCDIRGEGRGTPRTLLLRNFQNFWDLVPKVDLVYFDRIIYLETKPRPNAYSWPGFQGHSILSSMASPAQVTVTLSPLMSPKLCLFALIHTDHPHPEFSLPLNPNSIPKVACATWHFHRAQLSHTCAPSPPDPHRVNTALCHFSIS